MSDGSGMNRAAFDDLKDAYALGALSKDEERAFEEYLALNPELQSEVDDILQISSLLALSPPENAPSRNLRKNLLKTVRSESRSRTRDEPLLNKLRSVFTTRPLVVGIATVIVAALASWNVALQSQMTGLDRENSTLTAQVEQMTGRPVQDGRIFTMQGEGDMLSVEAEVVRMQDGKAVLIADGMPEIEETETFQMWVISGDDVQPGGVFESDGGPVAAVLEKPLEGADTVAVTIEPDGGSAQPTTSPQLTAQV